MGKNYAAFERSVNAKNTLRRFIHPKFSLYTKEFSYGELDKYWFDNGLELALTLLKSLVTKEKTNGKVGIPVLVLYHGRGPEDKNKMGLMQEIKFIILSDNSDSPKEQASNLANCANEIPGVRNLNKEEATWFESKISSIPMINVTYSFGDSKGTLERESIENIVRQQLQFSRFREMSSSIRIDINENGLYLFIVTKNKLMSQVKGIIKNLNSVQVLTENTCGGKNEPQKA